MIDPGLSGKNVLVTGANHGIGAATSRAFASQGAGVFLAFFVPPTPYTAQQLSEAREAGVGGMPLYHARQQQGAEPIAAEIRGRGGRAASWEADLADHSNVPRLFDRCEEAIGPVDVLVINHTHDVLETFDPGLATSGPTGVRTVTAAGIDAHFAVNARASALLIMEYARRYLARGATRGRIVAISTDAAHAHTANVSYAASKHAIESYARSAAAELGRYGITVNIVAPGPIQTGYIPPDLEAQVQRDTPLGRVGKPEDVADVIVFFASDQAGWLTGQLLYVGGGYRMGT